jgi:hypothetical protein
MKDKKHRMDKKQPKQRQGYEGQQAQQIYLEDGPGKADNSNTSIIVIDYMQR